MYYIAVSIFFSDLSDLSFKYGILLYRETVHREKEHSDWFPERSEFSHTDRSAMDRLRTNATELYTRRRKLF